MHEINIVLAYKVLHGCAPSYHLARLPTLPTFQVAEDFSLSAATASFNLRFIAPRVGSRAFSGCWPSGVELPATGGYVGTVSSALDSRHFCSRNHILTFG